SEITRFGAAGAFRRASSSWSGVSLAVAMPEILHLGLREQTWRQFVGPQHHANRFTNASAVSATSRQPLSIVSECPLPGVSTISVAAPLRFCFLKLALAIDHGTVWSFSPEMISSGPRLGFF